MPGSCHSARAATSSARCASSRHRRPTRSGREHATALASVLAQGLWRLRAAEAQLRAQAGLQRQQLQRTFLAAVSHDFRTPLAAIVGAASSLQTQRERLTATAGAHPRQHRRPGPVPPASPRTRCSLGPRPARWRRGRLGVHRGDRRQRAGRLRDATRRRIEAEVAGGLPLVRGDAPCSPSYSRTCSTTPASIADGRCSSACRAGEIHVRCSTAGPALRTRTSHASSTRSTGARRARRARGRPRPGGRPVDRPGPWRHVDAQPPPAAAPASARAARSGRRPRPTA